MAKAGNRSMGPKQVIEGSCVDCGKAHTDAPLTMIRRYGATGKKHMAKVCVNCAPKI